MEKTIYIIEEHHEAFRVWHHARVGENPPAELIHVDSHPDMSLLPRGIIPDTDASPEVVADFVQTALDLQTFITPAVFKGWFDRVIWVRPDLQKPVGSDTWIWKTKGRDDRLFMGKNMPESGMGKKFQYQWTGLGHKCPSGTGPTVLDIDLDFFASSAGPVSGSIEITKGEYERYCHDPRHYLRLHFGSRAEVKALKGRYTLLLTPDDSVHRAGIRDIENEKAFGTIEAFGAWLARNRINPDLVSICRSRISGFAPEGLWKSLEKKLISILESVYGRLRIINGDSLFKSIYVKPEPDSRTCRVFS